MTTSKQNLQYPSSYHTTNGADSGHDTSLSHSDGWNIRNPSRISLTNSPTWAYKSCLQSARHRQKNEIWFLIIRLVLANVLEEQVSIKVNKPPVPLEICNRTRLWANLWTSLVNGLSSTLIAARLPMLEVFLLKTLATILAFLG